MSSADEIVAIAVGNVKFVVVPSPVKEVIFMDMKKINWFPGHMVKTRREISANLKLVDAVIEIRDARIVSSSTNPEIEKLVEGKRQHFDLYASPC